jgi:sec-independent protein translocase protein TatC
MSELKEFGQHLDELRKRLLKVVIIIGAITVFILTFHAEPVAVGEAVLYYPVPEPLDNIAAQVTNHMRESLVPEDVELIQTAPGQAFFAQVYIAALVGLVAGMPIIVWNMVGFITPALKEREISVSKSISIPAIGLFAAGCVFAYVLVVPYILEFLYRYGESSGLVTFLNVIDFVAFVLQFLLAFGLSFQLPLVMYAASVSGATDAGFWRRNLRYAIVIIVIFGAVITPDGSGVTMWFIAGPMMALYLAGMFIIERKEGRTQT